MIRGAQAADRAAVERIVRDAYGIYVERIGKPPGPMLDDHGAHVAAGHSWVAEPDGDVAGLLVLVPQPDHLLLDNIAVDPQRHRQGIGAALMRHAEQEAVRLGHRELRLYTHALMTENQAIYLRLGWTETGRGAQQGYDRVFFRKSLPAVIA